MNNEAIAKFLIGAGVLLLIGGSIWYVAGDKLGWIGHLPGDIRIERENFRFYFPVTTMILLSVLLSILWYLVRRFF